MANILVTGGAGFIGSHIVDWLISEGHGHVMVLDDFSGGFKNNINHNVDTIFEGSITDPAWTELLFSNMKFDYVYHTAAYAAEGLSHFIRNFNYTNNLIGSVNLINAAIRHDCKCFVFTSSIAVYGEGQTPMREDTIPKPEDPYGISKYAVELDLMAARKMFGLNYIIFRPHNVYGERQNIGDSYRNVIGIFMNRTLQGLPCPIFGDGSQTRAFTHISDVAPVIANSINVKEAYNQIFNIGSDEACSVNELYNRVQMAMGREMKDWVGARHLPARNEVLHAFSDHSKLKEVFNTPARITLEEGLNRMARWVKAVGVRQGKAFDHIEIEKELPALWSNS